MQLLTKRESGNEVDSNEIPINALISARGLNLLNFLKENYYF